MRRRAGARAEGRRVAVHTGEEAAGGGGSVRSMAEAGATAR